ncbi:hypothetical protein AAHC03_04832 [Spirometra sp. Aus1]
MPLRLNTVCSQIGSSRMHFVRLLDPPESGVSCTSLWRCDTCGLSETEADIVYYEIDRTNTFSASTSPAASHVRRGPELYEEPVLAADRRQTVELFLRFSSDTFLSSVLPRGEVLNTTDLEISHSPVLVLDGEALTRLPHLRRLEVKQSWGEAPGNGVTRLQGNPFTGLPNPGKLRILRLSLNVCGCDEYRTFKWLKHWAQKLQANLHCRRVLDVTRTDLGALENSWVTQSEFIALWAPFCGDTEGALTVVPMTFQTISTKQKTSGGKFSTLDCTHIWTLIFSAFVNRISSLCL